jgi:hypothetical protein
MMTMAIAKPDYNICFNNSVADEQGNMKQVQIGKIDFNGGTMKFEGNFEESAVKFMDHLAATFQRQTQSRARGCGEAIG